MRATRRRFIEATAAGVASTAAGCQGIVGNTPTEDSPTAENEPFPTTGTGNSNRDGEGDEERHSRSVAPGEDIHEALASIPAGGRIIIEPGEHVIERPLSPPSNARVTVRGTVRIADGLEPDDDIQPKLVVAEDITDFVLEGPGTLDGNRENVTYSGDRHNHPGVHVINSRRVTIRDLEIRNVVAGASISMWNAGTVTVRNVYSHDHARQGAPCDGMFFNAEDAVIEGNTVRNVTDTYYAMDNCQHIRLVNNYGEQTDEYIQEYGGVAQCASCYAPNEEWIGAINNNWFYNPGNAANAAITSFKKAENGVTARITGNRITDANKGGVFLHSNATASTVANNTVSGSDTYGIEVRAPRTKVSGNTVTNAAVDGIVLRGNVTADGNEVSNAGLAGVRLVSGTSGASVTGNRVGGCSPGILLQSDVTRCLVANNVPERSRTYGISASATSDRNVFEGNLIRNSQNGAWDVAGNEDSTFANNRPAYDGT